MKSLKKITAVVLMSAVLSATIPMASCFNVEEEKAYVTGGVVTVSGGDVSGACNEDGSVAVYKGIPYAAAPVGDLRWRAPQPVTEWEGVKDCTLWGANALQGDATVFSYWTKEYIQDTDPTHYQNGVIYSEDCLNLNVWSSTGVTEDKPVLVYIHGGGYNSGGASCEVYDGEKVAQKDVVFVSIHYRVGALGYLATDALVAEDENGSAGNYGLLDQIAALEWVQDNIQSFGGDPNNVTVMGQSAGAGSVNALIASPLAKDLFVNAISASHNSINRDWQTVSQRCAETPTLYKNKTVEELRAIPASNLKGQTLPTVGPCVDGYVLTDTYRETVIAGKANDVNLMTGMVAKDDLISSVYTNTATQITAVDSMIALQGFLGEARKNGGYASNTYVYMFERNVPGNTAATTGAYHSYDLPYFFGVFSDERKNVWTQEDYDLSEIMMSYLVEFCDTGSPNGIDLPNWEANVGGYNYMSFNTVCVEKILDERKASNVKEYYNLNLGAQ